MRRLRNLGICMCAALIASGAIGVATCSASNGVAAWGENWSGQLGTGSFKQRSSPVMLSQPTGVIGVAAGSEFSVALIEGGTVKAWGDNVSGELGDGKKETESPKPIDVNNLSGVTAVAAGSSQAFALLSSGKVKAWGANELGQLGIGSTENKSEPVEIPELTGVTSISAQADDSLALKGGKVYAWGDNRYGQLGIGTTIGPEKCGLSESPCSKKPEEVHGLEKVIAISAGTDHDLALEENGTVWAWGNNETGGLGDGTTERRDEPVEVAGLGSPAIAVAAGWEFSLALLQNHTVVAWGDNYYGELGDGGVEGPEECPFACSVKPVPVTGLSKVIAISAAEEHSLAVIEGGTVKAWGINEDGDLGDGKSLGPETCAGSPCSRAPITVNSLTQEVVGVAAGEFFGLAYGPAGPIIKKVEPRTGPPEGGTTVTIKGLNFASSAKVEFGTTEGIEAKVEPPTTIVVKSPAGSGKVQVKVTMPTGIIPTSSSGSFRWATTEAPEIGRCLKVPEKTGAYSDAACTAGAPEGSFKWEPGAAKPQFSLSGGEAKLQTVAAETIICSGIGGSGEYTSAKEAAIATIKLTGCKHSGSTCRSSGAAEGELVTSGLSGELGWKNKATGAIALELSPTEAAYVIEGTCGASQVHVRGSVIVNVKRNEMTAAGTLTFEQTSGKQKPDHLVEGETAVLETLFEGGKYAQTGLAATITQTYEEPLEVNSAV